MPVARKTDPSTSHAAANSVTGLTNKQSWVLRCIQSGGPMTDQYLVEVYQHAARISPTLIPAQSESGLRTRRSELVALGKVRCVGEAKLDSGRMGKIWAARDAG